MGRRVNPGSKLWLRVVAVERSSRRHRSFLGSLTPGDRVSEAVAQIVQEAVAAPLFRGIAAVRSWSSAEAISFEITAVCECDELKEAAPEAWPAEAFAGEESLAAALASGDAPCFAPCEDGPVGGGGGVFEKTRPRLPLDIVVFLILLSPRNEVLLVRESKERARGKWFPPAGHMELGETLHETCRRELREETFLALDFSSVRVVDVIYGTSSSYSPLHFVVTADAITLGRLKVEADADKESIGAAWRLVPEVLAELEDSDKRRAYRNPDEVSYVLRTALGRCEAGCALPVQSVPQLPVRCEVLVATSDVMDEADLFPSLRKAGFTARAFRETAALLAVYRERPGFVAAVVVSRMLSGGRAEAGLMNGLSLLTQLRMEGPRPFPLLCLLSASANEEEAFAAGADCWVHEYIDAQAVLCRGLGVPPVAAP